MFHGSRVARRSVRNATCAAIGSVVALAVSTLSVVAEPSAAVAPRQVEPFDVGRVDELATETSDVYRQPDGSYQFIGHEAPVNYLSDDGSWDPIDNDLVPAAGDTYAVTNDANDYTVKLPEDAGSDPVKFASSDGEWVTFSMEGLDGAPAIEGSEAIYAQAGQGASEVVYEARGEGLKESIVLSTAPREATEFSFDLKTSAGLTPRRRPTGEVEFVDANSRQIFIMPSPFMTDAADVTSTDVTYELKPSASGWSLTVRPSLEWLQDPSRSYPVIVDPTIVEQLTDGWIGESSPTSVNAGGAYLRVGGLVGSRRRALLKFDMSSIPSGATISTASLDLYLDESLTTGSGAYDFVARRVAADQPWTPGWLSWTNRMNATPWSISGGAWGEASPAVSLNGSTSGWKSFNTLETVNRWVNLGWANNGFIVKQATDNNKMLWFKSANNGSQQPQLVVNYTYASAPPSTPNLALTAASCIEPCDRYWAGTHSLTPTLTSTSTDSDSATLSTTIAVRNAETGTTIETSPVLSGAQGQPVTWTVPSGELAPETLYEFRSTVTDGTQTRSTGWQPVAIVPAHAPDVASDLTLSPCASACGSLVSTSLTPTFSAVVNDEDLDVVGARFDLQLASSGAIIATSGNFLTASGGTASWTVPPGTLSNQTSYKLRVTSTDESASTSTTWVSFSTTLPTSGPVEPTNFTVSPCASPCTTWTPTSVTPTFSATRGSGSATTDVLFEIRYDAAVTTKTVVGVAPLATATWTVPAGTLGGAEAYEIRAGARSGGLTTWTGWRPFTVNTVATAGPAVPTLEVDNSEDDSGDPVNPQEVASAPPSADDTGTDYSFDDADLEAIDDAADVEYKQALQNGEVNPDLNAQARTRPVWVKYAPKLHLYSSDPYGPMSPWNMIDHADLMWSHAGGCENHNLARTINAQTLGDGGYDHQTYQGVCFNHDGDEDWDSDENVGPLKSGGPSGADGMYIQMNNDWRDGQGYNGTEPTYYVYDDRDFIKYWFFYGFSNIPGLDEGFGHEGDWESIAINLDSENRPEGVQYFQHGTSCYLPWRDVPTVNDRGRHPSVYVGKESHASYPEGGKPHEISIAGQDLAVDVINGLGPKWYANKNLQSATAQDWYGFGGIWGSYRYGGRDSWSEHISGPLGPGPARDDDSKYDPPTFKNVSRCDMY